MNTSNFAKVWVKWDTSGFQMRVESQLALESAEIFLDTRGQRGAIMNRFCHHFYFSPVTYEGFHGQELTRFRTEDAHELSDKALLEFKGNDKKMILEIPTEALVGFESSSRLGFTYRLDEKGRKQQHFSATTREYPIEHYPTVWGLLE